MYHLIVWLLTPFTLAWLIVSGGLLVVWRAQQGSQRRLWLVIVPWGVMTLLTMPAVAYFLQGSLEWQYDPLVERPEGAQAIVVLGGGNHFSEGKLPAELSDNSLQRCRYAAQVYRLGSPLPVFVSGRGEARAMHATLVDWNIPDDNVIDESESRSTGENAADTTALLKERHLQRILLVTDAAHMPRAVRAFQKLGLDVIPAPCNFRARSEGDLYRKFLPEAHAVSASTDALHEWIGIAWYMLTGKI